MVEQLTADELTVTPTPRYTTARDSTPSRSPGRNPTAGQTRDARATQRVIERLDATNPDRSRPFVS